MRLLILIPEYAASGGGIATFYRALVPTLANAGWDIRVIEGSALYAAERAQPRTVDSARIETLEVGRLERWWRQFSGLAGTPGLRRHLAAAWAMWEQADLAEGCDIVEAADWGLLFVPPVIDGRRPLVVQGHGSTGQIAMHDAIAGEEIQNRLIQLIERAAMAHAGGIHVTSRANAEFWRQETGREAHVIRPAFVPAGEHGGPVSTRGLVVGRIQRWKGPHLVCAAMELLGERAPAIDWFGRDMPWGRRESSGSAYLASRYPRTWGMKLIRHAPIAPDAIARRQAGALFNLVPSTWDTFNFTVAEAMASGRPAVVSTGAGASELVEDGITGFLFAADDARAMADAIARVQAAPPERLAEMGKAARESVRAALAPDSIGAQRIAAYREAIDSFERHRPAPVTGWLGTICRPAATDPCSRMAFLDHHPLRGILAYAAGRLARRLWPR